MTGPTNNTPACFSCLRPEDVRTGLSAADKYTAIRMAGDQLVDRKSTRLNSSHSDRSRMPSSA